MRRQGYTVVRVTAGEVMRNTAGVVNEIAEIVKRRGETG
jgi:very-short-patch-repair endonuclease